MNDHKSITDPNHYKGEIECWNIIWQLYGVNGCLSHMMGYNFRAGKKEGEPVEVAVQKIMRWGAFILRKLDEDSS